MIDIKNYMEDGACWQAQAVLAYVKGNITELTDSRYFNKSLQVGVGRYENCREQGYVISIRFYGKKDDDFEYVQRNYAVYQHRNSDTICVLISNTWTTNTPGIDDMWKDKGENPRSSDYDKGFGRDGIVDCGEYILEDIAYILTQYEIS
jgi:hypothetical protein